MFMFNKRFATEAYIFFIEQRLIERNVQIQLHKGKCFINVCDSRHFFFHILWKFLFKASLNSWILHSELGNVMHIKIQFIFSIPRIYIKLRGLFVGEVMKWKLAWDYAMLQYFRKMLNGLDRCEQCNESCSCVSAVNESTTHRVTVGCHCQPNNINIPILSAILLNLSGRKLENYKLNCVGFYQMVLAANMQKVLGKFISQFAQSFVPG